MSPRARQRVAKSPLEEAPRRLRRFLSILAAELAATPVLAFPPPHYVTALRMVHPKPRSAVARQNGAKGGRPRKGETAEQARARRAANPATLHPPKPSGPTPPAMVAFAMALLRADDGKAGE